jgi:hypothetical protein
MITHEEKILISRRLFKVLQIIDIKKKDISAILGFKNGCYLSMMLNENSFKSCPEHP